MTRFLIAPALALATLAAATLASAGGALADSDSPRVDVPREQWMSVGQIAEHFAAQGYDVRSVETEKAATRSRRWTRTAGAWRSTHIRSPAKS